jgi:hypothetical protein
MKQIARSLLSLGAFVVLGGGVALVAWLRATSPGLGEGDNEGLLLRLSARSVASFEVKDEGHRFRVERTPLGWDVVTPVRLAADPEKVEQMLETFARLRAKQRFDDTDPPPSESVLGFDLASSGSLVAWSDDTPPRRVQLLLGETNSFNRQEYARLRYDEEPGETVMLASGARRGLLKQASQLFDRRALGVRFDQVQRIRVAPRQPTEDRVAFTLERTSPLGEGAGFALVEPVATALDAFAARRLFEGLSGAPVAEFVTLDAGGALAAHGLKEPDFTITFSVLGPGGELSERQLFVGPLVEDTGGEAGDGYALVARSDQPWVGRVHALLYHALSQSLDDLKTKRVLSFERSQVRRIELKLATASHVALERGADESEWRLLAPEPGAASVPKVNSLVLTFAALTGSKRELERSQSLPEASLEAFGLDEKSAQRLRFFDGEGEVLGAVRVGKSEGAETFVMREGGDFVVRVPDKRLADLPKRAAELLQ